MGECMRDRLLAAEKVKAIDWRGEALYLLDQRILPFEENWLPYTNDDRDGCFIKGNCAGG